MNERKFRVYAMNVNEREQLQIGWIQSGYALGGRGTGLGREYYTSGYVSFACGCVRRYQECRGYVSFACGCARRYQGCRGGGN